MNKERIKKEITELKDQRNELQNKVWELQQQIDTLELSLQNLSNFSGKCIYYNKDGFGCEVYVKVDSVKKSFDGLMLEGCVINIYDDGSAELLQNDSYTIDYDDLLSIKEISEEAFKEVVCSKVNNIIGNM